MPALYYKKNQKKRWNGILHLFDILHISTCVWAHDNSGQADSKFILFGGVRIACVQCSGLVDESGFEWVQSGPNATLFQIM